MLFLIMDMTKDQTIVVFCNNVASNRPLDQNLIHPPNSFFTPHLTNLINHGKVTQLNFVNHDNTLPLFHPFPLNAIKPASNTR